MSASLAHAANGVGRGGGNGLVCFIDSKIADSLTVRDSNTGSVTYYKSIPDSLVSEINSIESYDLYLASLKKGTADNADVIQLSDNPNSSVEQEFERYADRFHDTFWYLDSQLKEYEEKIPFAEAQAYSSGLNPVYDIPALGLLPQGCVLATVFVQASEGDTTRWGFDSRLFYHPKHSKLSQVVFLLHERSYLIGRTLGGNDSSYFATQVVGDILDPNLTFTKLISDHKKIDPRLKTPCGEINWSPFHFLYMMYGQLEAVEEISGKSAALQLYHTQYRSALMANSDLTDEFKQKNDQNITNYLLSRSDQLVDLWYEILDWKIPLPAGYKVRQIPQR
jgi:hypothetical protein